VKLEDLLAVCARSKPTAWKVIPCGGGGAGPSFLEAWQRGPDGEPILAGAHTMRATYMPDVALSIAWGLAAGDGFVESWTAVFDGGPASSHFVDVFWNGALVERGLYVAVGVERCKLPIPQRDLDEPGPSGRWITRWQHRFFTLLNALEATSDLDDHLRTASIEIR
jgi:hypothetical protein